MESPSHNSSNRFLRIETGMHTAAIIRIGIDAANRFLVTASPDKTARVWEFPSGHLLRVLRPPIGAGNEGKLYSIAISPDGQTVAAGGWTSPDGLNTNIYIFDRESGRLLRRITDLPNVVNHLVYSRDGRYVAATLGRNNGLRVYQTASYTQVGEDRDYGADSFSADFDVANRLVTTSYDGFIRLYEVGGNASSGRGLSLVAKQKAEGGSRPFDVKFSSDGSRLAVGFRGSTKVNVLSGRDLSLLYVPDPSGLSWGDLFTVAWSVDGSFLYASGTVEAANNRRFIRAWTNSGRDGYRDILLDATSTILHLLPLHDGGVVYGAFDPAFGALDESGRQTLFTASGIADYRAMLQGFLLSADGETVQFGYELFGKSPARFSLAERRLNVPPQPATKGAVRLQPPITEAKGLAVTGWKDTYEPKLNGQPLKLDSYEMSRSHAIAPDASSFLLGTEYYIRLFDRTGKELWQTPVPVPAWGVNISADGRLAVAAYGDGTIRWYRMTDGQELLAFFPHRDQTRWVLWTPSGYYDASPGAEDLIGWHINNGPDQAADFFPVAQFRDTYYRPDVIAKVLQTGDEARALELANQESGRKQQEANIAQQLPPVVEIISPPDGSEVSTGEITVRYRIRTPSGEPVTDVKTLLDGRPADARELAHETTAEGERALQLTLPEHDSAVTIIAQNRFSESVPATVQLKWRKPMRRNLKIVDRTAAKSGIIMPKLYILTIGVSRYANEKFNLKFADKDAGDFVNVMLAQKDLLYRDVVIKKLVNKQATMITILKGLSWIRKETTSNDVAMIFFAGHGINDQNNDYFFCPHKFDPEDMLSTGVSFNIFKSVVSTIAGKALFFMDTCHSGNSLGLAPRRSLLDINKVINELSSAQNGVVVFSASTGSESAFERDDWNNGAFTEALVEGLNGAADLLNKGSITCATLNVYIAERVKELTGGQQHPTMISPQTIPDFPIAVKR
jgi:WD40 repeat protein